MSMKNFFYRVSNGETILSISQKVGVPALIIIKTNRLNSEVSDGDLLYIEKQDGILYKVQPFDTAKRIAEKFCLSEKTLLEKNGVDYLFYGLTIII